MKHLVLSLLGAGVLAALTACDDGGGNTDDTSDTNDSGNALTVDFNWDADGYNMSVTNMEGTGYDLGLAETGSTGVQWNGEDCMNGTEGYTYCHGFNGASASLTALGTTGAPSRDPDNVVEGQYTLLNKELAYNGDGSERLTYMITFDDASCVVWGHQVSHYSSRGCTVY